MLDLIAKLLPEWMVPLLLGLAVWFGLNWLILAPLIGERTVVKTCDRSQYAYCLCVADVMVAETRWKLALWTATGGLYEVIRDREVLSAIQEGARQCQTT